MLGGFFFGGGGQIVLHATINHSVETELDILSSSSLCVFMCERERVRSIVSLRTAETIVLLTVSLTVGPWVF